MPWTGAKPGNMAHLLAPKADRRLLLASTVTASGCDALTSISFCVGSSPAHTKLTHLCLEILNHT